MNKILIIVFFLFEVINIKAQNKQPSDFIPNNYLEFEKYFGDLNNDGIEDCVLMIKKVDTTNIITNQSNKKVDRNRRGIIILFKSDKGYQLADKNYSCFYSENEDGGVYYPPEIEIVIENNNLYIRYLHGRYGYWIYTFRFQNSNFKLIGYDSTSTFGPRINSITITSINFLTKRKLVKVNISPDDQLEEKFKEVWKDIKIENLIKLSEIKKLEELELLDN